MDRSRLPQAMQDRMNKVEARSEKAINKYSNKKSNKLCCPNCGATQIVIMGKQEKNFSIGKALGGAILTGGIGTLAGFTGKKGKYDCYCQSCGERFRVR